MNVKSYLWSDNIKLTLYFVFNFITTLLVQSVSGFLSIHIGLLVILIAHFVKKP